MGHELFKNTYLVCVLKCNVFKQTELELTNTDFQI